MEKSVRGLRALSIARRLVVVAFTLGAFALYGDAAFEDSNFEISDSSVRIVTIGNRTIYIFTNTTAAATITAKRQLTIERLLVVGGGGAGGYHFGGGGGGGGVVHRPYHAQTLASGAGATVVVGKGAVGNASTTTQSPGAASYWAVGAVTNMAYGGGSGGNYDNNTCSSGKIGSGGGSGGKTAGTHYTVGQGYPGGSAGGLNGGGGGGGATQAGENGGQTVDATYKRGGNGGEGLKLNITGADVVYGSGGGGGGRSGYNSKSGKGGTNAADGYWASDRHAGIDAPAGFGGGGGGTSYGGSYAGGRGGSGTVILQVMSGDTSAATPIGFAKPNDQILVGSSITLNLVVTNALTGAVLNPSDYTVTYVDNDKAGTCRVLVTTADGGFWQQCFTIYSVGYQDDNVSVTDASVTRVAVGKRYAYVFTNVTAETRLQFKRTATVEKYLVLGGGGAGGRHMGGGGGGGGLVYVDNDFFLGAAGDLAVLTIGAGGVGSTSNVTVPGNKSTLALPGRAMITAYGGGGGGTYDSASAPSSGKLGSGGGGASGSSGKTAGTHYTAAQGNYGGGASNCRAGGGGGASEPGADGVSSGASGKGGEGRTLRITGSDVVYGSGGGGGGGHGSYGGAPGAGGTNAGAGEAFGGSKGGNAAPAGFGGGGGGGCTVRGGNGGSGTVVLLVYPGDSATLQFVIDTIPDGLWYGTPVTPTVVVRRKSDSVVLTQGTDYTVAFADNNAPGVCTVTATGVDGSDYEGIVAQTTFRLARAYQFTVEQPPQQLYFNDPVTPEPLVTNSLLGVTLKKGTDFDYSYENNNAPGTAKVIATGRANYAGWAVTNAFTIAPTYSDDPNFIVSDTDFGVKTLGKRKVYVFTNAVVNTLRLKRTVTVEKMLLVGGGGAGGGHIAGGGGGGGVVYSENAFLLSAGQDVSVSVGAGGQCVASAVGKQGGTSALDLGNDTPVEAYGGGGGGCEQGQSPQSVTNGRIGSAGGAAHSVSYVDGQHYNSTQGTRGGLSAGGRCTTGGGGAGGHGLDYGQNGGPGLTCTITGVAEVYGSGGGAGGGWSSYGLKTYGVGGTHAGRGGAHDAYGGTAGDPGFGGGGGGSAHSAATGNGGSGTVILYLAERDTLNYRYKVIPPATQIWTREAIRPEPVVSNIVNGAILKKDVDYTLSWENCDGPGTGRVLATGIDGSDYDGAVEFADFTILDGCQFAILPVPTQYFYGEPVEPDVVVSNGVLNCIVAADQYGLVFAGNAALGTATVTATGLVDSIYRDFTTSRTFEIKQGYSDDYLRIDDLSVRRIENGNRLVYVFTNTMASKIVACADMTLQEFLVVGGGGQGGGQLAGGGGGGGVITNAIQRLFLTGSEFAVTVGAGGRWTGTGDAQGDRGEASSFSGDGFSFVACGGGGGGTCNDSTKRGVWTQNGWPTDGGLLGSGGGTTKGRSAGSDGIQFTLGQGHSGGVGSGYLGGGGGGAGSAGKNSSGSISGNGGEGITNAITGVAEVYGSGGGGGGGRPGTGGTAGVGGTHAGNGATYNVTGYGFKGDDGFGAGGGGGGYTGTVRGGYGGSGTVILSFTVGASVGQPELAEKDVAFAALGNYAIPRVAFTLGGEEGAIYAATVVLSIGVEDEAEARFTQTLTDKHLGDTISVNADFAVPSGKKTWCDIVVSAEGAEDRHVHVEKSIGGQPAPFIGHGGAGVYHVWASAPGNGDGSNWLNAMPDLDTALKACLASGLSWRDIWICGDLIVTNAARTVSPSSAFALRGGFTGVEDFAGQRTGRRSTLNATNAVDLLSFGGAGIITLDSLDLRQAKNRGVYRDGAGSLVVTNCAVEGCGRSVTQVDGHAFWLKGGSGATATFVDTHIANNYDTQQYCGRCAAVELSNYARATFDRCLFTTNGVTPFCNSGSNGPGELQCYGAAVYANGVPLTMRACEIRCNRSANRGSDRGGIVRLNGAAWPSAFTNCLFVGNSGREATGGEKDPLNVGGAISVTLNRAEGTVDIDNCTFAWNLECARRSPAGVNAVKGKVKVRNSIFWGNAKRPTNTAGCDIDVKADGSLDVDYSLFAENSTNYLTCAEGGTLTVGSHCVWANPRFATRDANLSGIILSNKTSFTTFVYFDWNRLNELVNFNAHLGGAGGYVDERTGRFGRAHGNSPALEAGDPAHAWTREPADTRTTTNGKRVNLGYYGNTPWATMSLVPGSFLRVR